MIGDGRVSAVWGYFNPPKKLTEASFANYKPETGEQQEALKMCQRYSAKLDNVWLGKGILLFGSWGAGKSHLSIAVVRELIEKYSEQFGVRKQPAGEDGFGAELYEPDARSYSGIYCSFFSVVDLLDLLRPGNESKKRRAAWAWTRARNDDLVVFDDIGAEKPSDWVEARLYSLIDSRERMQKATIFTSNCTKDELFDQLGGRITSRIQGITTPVLVTGPDYRQLSKRGGGL